MKDNTLRNEIREILLGLDLGYKYQMSDYAGSREEEAEYEAEGLAHVEQALGAILLAIKNRLPKEFTPESYEAKYGKGSFKRDAYEMTGYNAAIVEVKQALDIESAEHLLRLSRQHLQAPKRKLSQAGGTLRMKWFRKRIGNLTIEYMGHAIHTCNGHGETVLGSGGSSIVGEYFTILWRGQVKFEQIVRLSK